MAFSCIYYILAEGTLALFGDWKRVNGIELMLQVYMLPCVFIAREVLASNLLGPFVFRDGLQMSKLMSKSSDQSLQF